MSRFICFALVGVLALSSVGCGSGGTPINTLNAPLCVSSYPLSMTGYLAQSQCAGNEFDMAVRGGVCCDDYSVRLLTSNHDLSLYPNKGFRIKLIDENGTVQFSGLLYGNGFQPEEIGNDPSQVLTEVSTDGYRGGLTIDIDGNPGGGIFPLSGIGRLEEALPPGSDLDKLPCGWTALFYGVALSTRSAGGEIVPLNSAQVVCGGTGNLKWTCSETDCSQAGTLPGNDDLAALIQQDIADTTALCASLEMTVAEFYFYELLDQNVDPFAFTNQFVRVFVRGDANGDDTINIADAIALLNHVTGGTAIETACLERLDANDDGTINIADPMFLLSILDGSTPQPVGYGELIEDEDLNAITCEADGGMGYVHSSGE